MGETRIRSILAISVLLTACSAQADPIQLGVWYQFVMGGDYDPMAPGGPCAGCLLAAGSLEPDLPPWTFALPSNGGLVTVQDVFVPGEVYHIFDFGVLVGTTRLAPLDIEYDCGYDVHYCLGHYKYSWGRFPLGPGPHSIVITFAPVPWQPLFAFMGYFRVDHAPEPGTWLSGAGLAAFALLRRSRKRRQAQGIAGGRQRRRLLQLRSDVPQGPRGKPRGDRRTHCSSPAGAWHPERGDLLRCGPHRAPCADGG